MITRTTPDPAHIAEVNARVRTACTLVGRYGGHVATEQVFDWLAVTRDPVVLHAACRAAAMGDHALAASMFAGAAEEDV